MDLTQEDERFVLRVDSDLEGAAFIAFQDCFDTFEQRGGTRLVIDLSGLRRIRSTGIAALIWAGKRCRRSGWHLALVVTDATIASVLRTTRLDGWVPVRADLAAAAAAVDG